MYGDVPGWLSNTGTSALALVSVLVGLAAISKLPPVKFVWRHLVTKPIEEWQRSQIEPVAAKVDEIGDEVTKVRTEQKAVATELRGHIIKEARDAAAWEREQNRREEQDKRDRDLRQAESDRRFDRLESGLTRVHERIDTLKDGP